MTLHHTYMPLEDSLASAKYVSGFQIAYDGLQSIRSLTKKVVLTFMGLFFGIPYLYVTGLLAYFTRKKITKRMFRTSVEFRDNCQYVQHKKGMEEFEKLLPTLKMMASFDRTKVPLLLRIPVKQYQLLSVTLLAFYSRLQKKTEQLDYTGQFGDAKAFTFRREDDMWKKRNKAYSYWT